MTWLDALLYGPGWLACALIPVNWWAERRFRRSRERELPVRGGVIAFPARLSDDEVEALEAWWQEKYGSPAPRREEEPGKPDA